MSANLLKHIEPGIVTGRDVQELFRIAKEHEFALPAVNVIGTNSVNAVLEVARDVNSPVIIQFSNGGAQFFAGKTLSNESQRATIAGAISGARHIELMAKEYGVRVILHTDHAAMKLLPWIDGLLEASEANFKATGKPLFSSHMLDLSEESLEENIAISKRYLERMKKMGMTLEVELGVTGGEEDGVDNTGIESSKLYTQPEEVAEMYKALLEVSDQFTIAASFGNTGQRCMAATVMVAVGDVQHIIDLTAKKAKEFEVGRDHGAVISSQSVQRIRGYVDGAEKLGARVLVDGRNADVSGCPDGFWMGA